MTSANPTTPHRCDRTPLLNFGGRRLAMVRQTEAAECGLACLAMVAGWHGLDTDLTTLRRLFPISIKGATLEDLVSIAGSLDLTTRAVRCDLDDTKRLACPASCTGSSSTSSCCGA